MSETTSRKPIAPENAYVLVVEDNVVRLNPFFYKPEHQAEIKLFFPLSRRFVHAFMNQRVADGEEGKA